MNAILKAEIMAIRNRLKARLSAVMAELADDPLKEWIAVQNEFEAWLAATKGADRLTSEAENAVEDMHRRSDAAKARWQSRDDVKLTDERFGLESAIADWDWEFRRLTAAT